MVSEPIGFITVRCLAVIVDETGGSVGCPLGTTWSKSSGFAGSRDSGLNEEEFVNSDSVEADVLVVGGEDSDGKSDPIPGIGEEGSSTFELMNSDPKVRVVPGEVGVEDSVIKSVTIPDDVELGK